MAAGGSPAFRFPHGFRVGIFESANSSRVSTGKGEGGLVRLARFIGARAASPIRDFSGCERQDGFQLSLAPLMRLYLLQLDGNTYQFVWNFHHLLLDGWSLPLVIKDLLDFYHAISQGESLRHIGTVSYRNYIAWLQQQNHDLAKEFWRQKLVLFTAPTPLTVDKPLSTRETAF